LMSNFIMEGISTQTRTSNKNNYTQFFNYVIRNCESVLFQFIFLYYF